MTNINYNELNRKILEIIKRKPINFAWVMTPIPESMGMRYITDHVYIEYPCGWFKKLHLKFFILNPQAPREHYVYVLTTIRLHNLFRTYEIPLNKIIDNVIITKYITDYASNVLKQCKQTNEDISLKFNRIINRLITKIN